MGSRVYAIMFANIDGFKYPLDVYVTEKDFQEDIMENVHRALEIGINENCGFRGIEIKVFGERENECNK